MEQQLKGKSALVTGASRGIGAATAIALARAGAGPITIQYNSYRHGAERTVEAIAALGAKASAIQADFSRMEGIGVFLREVDFKVDILVNNAGDLIKRARLAEVTPDLYDQVMALNTKSAFFITQAVVPYMIERKSGVVVFVSSIAARNGGGIGAAVYAAAKSAVLCLTRGLARELGPHGIRVNGVSPGTVDNYFHEKHNTPAILENMRTQTVCGRLGTNEEVADGIVFLCSHESRYIYGQTIEINGDMYMM